MLAKCSNGLVRSQSAPLAKSAQMHRESLSEQAHHNQELTHRSQHANEHQPQLVQGADENFRDVQVFVLS